MYKTKVKKNHNTIEIKMNKKKQIKKVANTFSELRQQIETPF